MGRAYWEVHVCPKFLHQRQKHYCSLLCWVVHLLSQLVSSLFAGKSWKMVLFHVESFTATAQLRRVHRRRRRATICWLFILLSSGRPGTVGNRVYCVVFRLILLLIVSAAADLRKEYNNSMQVLTAILTGALTGSVQCVVAVLLLVN